MKSILKAVFLISAAAAIAAAGDKPNFSGDWKINLAKSNWGVVPPPTSLARKVTHSEPSLTITDDQKGGSGDQNYTRAYTTDGKEITFQASGADVKSSAAWDGDGMMIKSTAAVAGIEVNYKDKMTLSDGGKTMTDVIHIAAPQGELDITIVFDKQ